MPRLLSIDDDANIQQCMRYVFTDPNVAVSVALTGEEGLRMYESEHPDAVLLDVHLPDTSGLSLFQRLRDINPKTPIILMTGQGTSDIAIEAMRLGAYDYLPKPFDPDQLNQLVTRAFEIGRLMHVPVKLPAQDSESGESDLMIGQSAAMQEVYKSIGRVAPQDVTVLIQGESGTGKELVARAIYHYSNRASGPFLAINCAAIPEMLLESELFGHEKGAFTGADRRRIGKFEQCNGGTIFLDEIGDMPLLLQSKILRLLQGQQFERVGGTESIQADVRIIAATHRNLEQMIEAGTFRPDLYYRLNVFNVRLPALRDRLDDLPLLVQYFLRSAARELKRSVTEISPEALQVLKSYHWPGNIRELQSIIRQSVLKTIGPLLDVPFLPELVVRTAAQSAPHVPPSTNDDESRWEQFINERIRLNSEDVYDEAMSIMERKLFAQVLRHTAGNQIEAAKILGISRSTLRERVRKLGISISQVVDAV